MTILFQYTPLHAPILAIPPPQVVTPTTVGGVRVGSVRIKHGLHASRQHSFIWSGYTPTITPPPTGPFVAQDRVAAVALTGGLHPSRQGGFVWSTYTPPSSGAGTTISANARVAAVSGPMGLHVSRQNSFFWSGFTPSVAPPVNDGWYRDLSIPFMPKWSGGT